MVSNRVKVVFKEPWQWGLRGDPHLWKELREYFSAAGLPETPEEFVQEVEFQIRAITGSDLNGDEPVFVERYDSGGMSSGHVSPEWWRETGFPLLRSQFGNE